MTQNDSTLYLPLSADRMMKHLKYKAIRKAIYDDILENSISHDNTTTKASSKALIRSEDRRTNNKTTGFKLKTNKYEQLDRSMKVIKSFMRIFTGYNVNNTTPSQNLVSKLILKRSNLGDSNKLVLNKTSKIKIRVPSHDRKIETSNHSRMNIRKSHGFINHKQLKADGNDYPNIGSVRYSYRTHKNSIIPSSSTRTRLSTSKSNKRRKKPSMISTGLHDFHFDSGKISSIFANNTVKHTKSKFKGNNDHCIKFLQNIKYFKFDNFAYDADI